MPVLKPGVTDPLFDVELTDGHYGFLLRADGGPGEIRESVVEGSNTFVTGTLGRSGEGEAGDALEEQRTWVGGRGNEDFFNDPTRYYDARMAWTATDEVVTHVPEQFWSKGYRDADFHTAGSKTWKSLIDGQRYMSISFSAGSSYSALKVYEWIRRVGDPDDLTLELCDDSAGEPGTVLKSKTVGISNITDVLSEFWGFEFASAQSLTASTTYHIKIYGASTDDESSHWEVAVDESGSGALISEDGSTWTSKSWKPYYRVTAADNTGEWVLFRNGALYGAFADDDGSASSLYINGDRGVVTTTSTITVTDSNSGVSSGWGTDDWAGAYFKVVAGTGKGTRRRIASNGSTTLVLERAPDVTLDTTTEYIIYYADLWQDISPAAGDQIDGVIKSTATVNNITYMAQGPDVNMLKMKYDSSTTAHVFDDDGTNKADLLFKGYDPTNGIQIWRATNNNVSMSRADAIAWSTATALSFGSDIAIGDQTYAITGITQGGEPIYVTKEDSIGYILNDEYTPLPVPLDSMPEYTNGQAVLVHGEFIYFNWTYSMERLYGDIVNAQNLNLDDIDINRGAGLPDNRQGPIVAMTGHPVGPLMAIDAGDDGYSSVLMYDGRAFFEVYRAWEVGQRIKNVFLQGNDDARPRLWISVGNDLVYMDLPKHHRDPLRDSALTFHHEFVLELSTIDFGNTEIPKAFKALAATSANLDGSGINVYVDFQTDENIGTASWNPYEGEFSLSPSDRVDVDVGKKRKIRWRLRGYTDNNVKPSKVYSLVTSGYGKKKLKFQWTIPIRLSEVEELLGGPDPMDFMTWLENASEDTGVVHVFSRHPRLHNRKVVIEHGDLATQYIDAIEQSFSGVLEIVLREYGS